MSRKFLDDNVQLKVYLGQGLAGLSKNELTRIDPLNTYDTRYDPGHTLLNATDGTVFTNQGDAILSIWGNKIVNRYELYDNFSLIPAKTADSAYTVNPNFEILGTNSTTALATAAAGGGVTITTAGAAADSMIILPHLATVVTAWKTVSWSTSLRPVFEVSLLTGASVANQTIWAGLKLTNTPVTATDNDQVFVRVQDTVSGGAFTLVTSNNNVDTVTVSTIIPVAATTYHIKIKVDANLIATLFINGVIAAKSSAALRAVNLIPYVGILAGAAAAAEAVTVRGIKLSQDM
jgi:hypothetical protein